MHKFSKIFEYEYIDEDFGTDDYNSIYYCEIILLIDLFGLKKGDKLDHIIFEAATGILKYKDKEYNLII